jgi:hypothetical protein
MIVVPMRSKFVACLTEMGDVEEDFKEDFTYEMDTSIHSKFPRWMSSLLDLLIEHYPENPFVQLPLEMSQWQSSLSMVNNPVGPWLQSKIVVSQDLKDYVLLSVVKDMYYREDHEGYVKEQKWMVFAVSYLATVPGVKYKSECRVKDPESGQWRTCRNVLFGATV